MIQDKHTATAAHPGAEVRTVNLYTHTHTHENLPHEYVQGWSGDNFSKKWNKITLDLERNFNSKWYFDKTV